MDNEGAGAGQDDGQGGSGAPSGGSSEGGSENDDKPITAKQLKAALASQKAFYERELTNRDAQLNAFMAGGGGKKQQEAPQRHSRATLKAAVDAGQVTQEQADEVWAKQIQTDAVESATAAATEIVNRKTTTETIDTEINRYRQLKPEIMEEGSELRERIREEFQALVKIGMPGEREKNLPTQLAAIRAVLGPLDKLERAAGARRAQESEQQGGGSGDGKPKGGGSGKKLADSLTREAREFYDKGIKQGRYKDWDEVEKELKYATPRSRRTLGLPA